MGPGLPASGWPEVCNVLASRNTNAPSAADAAATPVGETVPALRSERRARTVPSLIR